MRVLAASDVRLDANGLDYSLLGVYFILVISIGLLARRAVSNSEDFFLSGRSLPAWVTGLAFISANLGAIEILGMAANGAQYGFTTVHFYWIGAVPAMIFLGLVMMPFYYGSGVHSVPEYLRRRFNRSAHLFNAVSFAVAQVLTAGVNLYALALVIQSMLGWNKWLAICVAAGFVLVYITLGGLSGSDLQRGPAVLRHHRRADSRSGDRTGQGARVERPARPDQDHRARRARLQHLVGHRIPLDQPAR